MTFLTSTTWETSEEAEEAVKKILWNIQTSGNFNEEISKLLKVRQQIENVILDMTRNSTSQLTM